MKKKTHWPKASGRQRHSLPAFTLEPVLRTMFVPTLSAAFSLPEIFAPDFELEDPPLDVTSCVETGLEADDASAYCPTPSVPVLTPNGELDDSCIDNVETSALSLGDELQMSPTPKDSRLSSVSTFQTPKDTSSSPSSRLSVGRNSASRTRDRTGSDLSEISDSSEPDSPPSLAKIEIKADVPMPPPPICPISHDGKILIDCVLPFNVDQLFNMIFTASNFYLSFQAERKTTDLQANSWLPQDNGTKLRKISYTIQLASFGIKSCRTSENQVLLSHSQPGSLYSLDCEIQNSGIPYSDTFHVLSHFCLSRVSHSETNVVVSSHIKYKKSVWGLVKNFIEKNTWAGMEEYYSHLEKYLRAIPPPESADEDISRGSKKESVQFLQFSHRKCQRL